MNRPDLQLAAIQNKKCDAICVGRTLICDPDYPNKLKEGKLDDIVYCISCNKACHDRTAGDRFLHCTLNVSVGRETDPAYAIKEAEVKKKVMVVGGGPSGMEAARVAKLRGHEVTLYEKAEKLGGRLILAAVPPSKHGYGEACDYLIKQIEKNEIPVRFCTVVTKEVIEEEKPDVIILSTGTKPLVPPIPNIDKPVVVEVDEILKGNIVAGKKCVIIGGGAVGAETAHWIMTQEKRECDIIEMRDGIGIDMPQDSRICLMDEYEKIPDLHVHTGSVVKEIGDDYVVYENAGKLKTIKDVDMVILAAGAKPNRELEEVAREYTKEVYIVGDAAHPKDLVKAIKEGYEAGVKA